jgi:hypothetical protein
MSPSSELIHNWQQRRVFMQPVRVPEVRPTHASYPADLILKIIFRFLEEGPCRSSSLSLYDTIRPGLHQRQKRGVCEVFSKLIEVINGYISGVRTI